MCITISCVSFVSLSSTSTFSTYSFMVDIGFFRKVNILSAISSIFCFASLYSSSNFSCKSKTVATFGEMAFSTESIPQTSRAPATSKTFQSASAGKMMYRTATYATLANARHMKTMRVVGNTYQCTGIVAGIDCMTRNGDIRFEREFF